MGCMVVSMLCGCVVAVCGVCSVSVMCWVVCVVAGSCGWGAAAEGAAGVADELPVAAAAYEPGAAVPVPLWEGGAAIVWVVEGGGGRKVPGLRARRACRACCWLSSPFSSFWWMSSAWMLAGQSREKGLCAPPQYRHRGVPVHSSAPWEPLQVRHLDLNRQEEIPCPYDRQR